MTLLHPRFLVRLTLLCLVFTNPVEIAALSYSNVCHLLKIIRLSNPRMLLKFCITVGAQGLVSEAPTLCAGSFGDKIPKQLNRGHRGKEGWTPPASLARGGGGKQWTRDDKICRERANIDGKNMLTPLVAKWWFVDLEGVTTELRSRRTHREGCEVCRDKCWRPWSHSYVIIQIKTKKYINQLLILTLSVFLLDYERIQ